MRKRFIFIASLVFSLMVTGNSFASALLLKNETQNYQFRIISPSVVHGGGNLLNAGDQIINPYNSRLMTYDGVSFHCNGVVAMIVQVAKIGSNFEDPASIQIYSTFNTCGGNTNGTNSKTTQKSSNWPSNLSVTHGDGMNTTTVWIRD